MIMKNLFKYTYSALVGVAALTAVSCSDKYEYEGRGDWDAAADYSNVYFPQSSDVVELDPADPTTYSFQVGRRVEHQYTYAKDIEGNDSLIDDKIVTSLPAKTMKVSVLQNSDDVFTVSDAVFAEGDSLATITVTFPNAEIGTPYTLQVTVDDPEFTSNYSKDILYTVDVTRVKWNSLGIGTISEGFYLGYSANVEIQQRDDKPAVFRLIKPLDDILAQDLADYPGDAPYMNGLQPEKLVFTVLKPGDVVSEQTYNGPITIKGNDLVDYNTYHLGFTSSSYGEPVKCYHPKSMRATADEASWSFNTVLSYQADGKTPGQVQFAPFYYMDGVGGWNNTQSNGIVVITFPGYTPLYVATIEDDYDWEEVFAGMYTSVQMGTKKDQVKLYKGIRKADVEAENEGCFDRFEDVYGIPYRIEAPYAEGYDLFFCLKDGEIVVPEDYESQPLGIQAVGNDVYGTIGAGGSTFGDIQIELKITFTNKDGSVEYGTAVENLLNFVPTEDDVFGNFTLTYVSSYDNTTYEGGTTTIAADAETENGLIMTNLLAEGSQFGGTYNLADRLVSIEPYDVIGPETYNGSTIYLVLYSQAYADNLDFVINPDGTLTTTDLGIVAYNEDLTQALGWWEKASIATLTKTTKASKSPKVTSFVPLTKKVKAPKVDVRNLKMLQH